MFCFRDRKSHESLKYPLQIFTCIISVIMLLVGPSASDFLVLYMRLLKNAVNK